MVNTNTNVPITTSTLMIRTPIIFHMPFLHTVGEHNLAKANRDLEKAVSLAFPDSEKVTLNRD